MFSIFLSQNIFVHKNQIFLGPYYLNTLHLRLLDLAVCGLSNPACVPQSSICFIIITSRVHPVITKYTIVLLCATMLSITHRSFPTTFSTSNNRPVIKIETSCPIFRFIAGFVPSKLFGILGTTIKLDTCCQIVRGKKLLNFSPLHHH